MVLMEMGSLIVHKITPYKCITFICYIWSILLPAYSIFVFVHMPGLKKFLLDVARMNLFNPRNKLNVKFWSTSVITNSLNQQWKPSLTFWTWIRYCSGLKAGASVWGGRDPKVYGESSIFLGLVSFSSNNSQESIYSAAPSEAHIDTILKNFVICEQEKLEQKLKNGIIQDVN